MDSQLLYDEPLYTAMNSNWYGLFHDFPGIDRILSRVVTDLGSSGDGEKETTWYSVFSSGAGIVGTGTLNRNGSITDLDYDNDGVNHFGSPFNFPEEFVSVYRLHPLLPDLIELRDAQADPNRIVAKLPIVTTFRHKATDVMHETGLENMALSMGQRLGALGLKNQPQFLQNLSMPSRPEGPTKVVDVMALDIMRDRERGIPRFNEFRRQIGLRQMTSFSDFVDQRLAQKEDRTDEEDQTLAQQRALAQKLREVYGQHVCDASRIISTTQLSPDGAAGGTGQSPFPDDCLGHPDGSLVDNVEDVDTVVGYLAESTRPHGFAISETQFQIFIVNASRRLFSDRFFTSSFRPEFYSTFGLDWVINNGPDKQMERGRPNGHKQEVMPLKRVLQRNLPGLHDQLDPVINAFDPWARDRGIITAWIGCRSNRRAATLPLTPRSPRNEPAPPLTWIFRRTVWNSISLLIFRFKKARKIPLPPRNPQPLRLVPVAERIPGVEVTDIYMADRIPPGESDRIMQASFSFRIWLSQVLPPVRPGLPQIDADINKAMEAACRPAYRRLYPPPALPDAFRHAGLPDLGEMATASPYACFLEKNAAGELVWDFTDLDQHEIYPGLRPLGCRVYFQVKKASGKLTATRITCVLGDIKSDDGRWNEAVRTAMCAASTRISLVNHFGWVHLACGGPLSVATRNHLYRDHPICRLMWPHMFGTQNSNYLVAKGQMLRGGDFETVFSFTHEGMTDLFQRTFNSYRASVMVPALDWRDRGLPEGEFDTPVQDNLRDLYNVMHTHTTRYINAYYDSDKAVQWDETIMAWLRALNDHIPNGIDGVTGGVVTRESLATLCALHLHGLCPARGAGQLHVELPDVGRQEPGADPDQWQKGACGRVPAPAECQFQPECGPCETDAGSVLFRG
ncbi:peroxidase family protein [Sulfitobacter porphyrae]|uniref:Peroxidase family protein n=1 Tax=Sulfitobacter porphyrae TaxID=1246864 RepID=A0ABW2B4C0_9RHOB